ncbi:cadherin-like domain-containing protein [Corallococcus macrosporus]|uniref:Cadherin-like domain-containing protein n=1 Tax=Corallococcus macrosporus TaxID=35 RepID=A0ABS3DN38_9BACT|nr:cadherin-like domain-containing protein [Corallococcus macrosporus]MBN8232741.1 cadherin-like domain-containing protein [Corallococcus macrosporus]
MSWECPSTMFHSSVARLSPLLGVLAALTLSSCQATSVPEDDSPAVAPSAPPETRAPFDVSAVMRQVHFAYRPDGAAWSGGHSTYGVKVGTEGLTLTPFASLNGTVKGAPLSLGVMRWQRGGRSAGLNAAQARLEQAGHLTLAREGFTESLRNTEEGVRQEWVFSEAPEGAGALVLTVPVKGLVYVGSTEQGLHFKDSRTGLGFRHGHAAWVEASGRSTPLPARYVAGAIQYRVPSAVLEASVFPATVAPVISPEFGMDQPVPAPQQGIQINPAVASNGTGQLVVWEDRRQGTAQLVGTRVSNRAEVQDVFGIVLGPVQAFSDLFALASNGTDYLVVWKPTSDGKLQARRVSPAGELLDTAPIILFPASSETQTAPAVASDGTDYLVTAWSSSTAGRRVVGARVTGAGAVLEPAGFTLATSAVTRGRPAVASNGTDYFVAWEDSPDSQEGRVLGARVTRTGTVLDAQALPLAAGAPGLRAPAVASNGTDYLVAWREQGADPENRLLGTRVTSAGTVLDGPGFELSPPGALPSAPVIASDGEGYLVVWSVDRSGQDVLLGTRVTSAGGVVDGGALDLFAAPGEHTEPAVAFNGTDYFVAWERAFDILGMRVTPAREVLDASGVVLSTSASTQTKPVVASNGTDYLVVWSDTGHGGQSVVGVRVTAEGQVLDPSGLAIAWGAGDTGGGVDPAVASNGTDYLVIWAHYRAWSPEILGTRITSTGEILHPSGRRLSPEGGLGARSPALASNGTDYLVTFLQSQEEGASIVAGVRVSGQGEARDASALRIAEGTGYPSDPRVASNGKDYLVVWADSRGSDVDIHGSRVTSEGTVLEPWGLPISTARYDQKSPAVASNGTDYLVTWAGFSGNNIPHIQGARLTGTGTVLDPAGFVISTNRYQQFPSVASLGTEYLVTWQDSVVNSPNSNVYGARVTGAGVVREPQGIPIAASTDKEGTPAVVAPGTGRTAFVVYDHEDTAAPYWSHRTRGRLVTFNDNRPPSAMAQAVSTKEDTPVSLTLQGTDPDGQGLSYVIMSPPLHGTLSGEGRDRTYQPTARYSGPDSFTFRVSDGEFFSATVAVSIQVTGVNHAPSVPVLLAPEAQARLEEGTVTFQWGASADVDGDAVTYALEVLQEGTRLRLYKTAQTTGSLGTDEALPLGNYTWRVSAVDSKDASSGASPERGFTVTGEETADGGSLDGGGDTDAGIPDAGPASDGGVKPAPAPLPEDTSGCGCSPVSGAAPMAPMILAALGLLVGRSRRRR